MSPQWLEEEAADWFIRVRAAGLDSDMHTAWLAWIEADPAHRRAFEEMQKAWDTVGRIKSPPWPKPQELASAARSFSPRRASMWAALAASVAVAAVVLSVLSARSPDSERIATRRGELQSAVLPDGSRIDLGAATSVKLDFTRERRLIEAGEGEVFYTVEHDPKRPFVVATGPLKITAIGTAFSVRHEGDAVSVVVTEGAVDVKTADDSLSPGVRAQAGQRVRYDRGRLSATAEPVQAGMADGAWRRGQLRFEDEPLRVVVANLNRYSPKHIVLIDPKLAELRFTGTVFNDSTEDWLNAVELVFPVRVDRTARDRVTIESRR